MTSFSNGRGDGDVINSTDKQFQLQSCRCRDRHHNFNYTSRLSDDECNTQRDLIRHNTNESTVTDITSLKKLQNLNNNRKYPSTTSSSSSFNFFRTRIFPGLSMWKLFLLVHLLMIFVQINKCESSGRWWSIANIPLSDESISLYSRKHNRRYPLPSARQKSSNLYSAIRQTHPEEFDDILSNDKIREILSTNNIASSASTEGHGTFENSNQNKRDVTDNHIIDISTDKNKPTSVTTSSISAKMKPILVEQRVQLLNRKQRRLLRKNHGALEEIIKGLQLAMKECKFQFRNRRWMCPTNARDSTLFGKILNRGFRETAFIYAITSAAVSHAVARGCSQGKIESCGCDERRGEGGPGWEWGGCSDNFKFGKKFAKDFVNAGEVGTDLKCRMNLFNNEAGRQTVAETGLKFCKCHGMSGSCTVKTCWLRTATFRVVGRRLRDKYDDAEKVTISNHGKLGKRDSGLVPANSRGKPPKKGDLVYFESSPSFCSKNAEFWIEGTRGKTCNATSNGLNGCDSMCCGRGFKTRVRTIKQRCKCEFQWCCKVNCQICEVEKEISTCK